jgi:hypothetical protein
MYIFAVIYCQRIGGRNRLAASCTLARDRVTRARVKVGAILRPGSRSRQGVARADARVRTLLIVLAVRGHDSRAALLG